MNRPRAILLICLLLLSTFILTSCAVQEKEKNGAESVQMAESAATETVSDTRQVVTISGSAQDAELKSAVDRFNAANKEYRVEIVKTDYTRLMVEIMLGQGPDLFPLKQVGARECVEKGVVEDLTPYLEQSEALNQGKVSEKVLELTTIDGVLTCVPPTYAISTLWGKASMVGTEAGWTPEAFLECVESNKGLTVMEGVMRADSRSQLVLMMWNARQNEWVDWEAGKAVFTDSAFTDLFYYAAAYEAEYDDENGATTEERWQNGKVLLYTRPVLKIENYLYLKQLSDGDLTAKGYPAEDGLPSHMVTLYGDYAINVKSEHKDGAWAFIEFLVSMQTAKDSYNNAMPTLESAFEAMCQNALQMSGTAINGVEILPATQDDILAFKELLEGARLADDGRSTVRSILEEEISACFLDGRSLEETIDIIQSRVQLFLDEL